MTIIFWAVVLTFLFLRVHYYFANKTDSDEWNRRHMEMEMYYD
jgi:uncharacterized MAPEG superfamily protein